jgi:hypothetical protein
VPQFDQDSLALCLFSGVSQQPAVLLHRTPDSIPSVGFIFKFATLGTLGWMIFF